jgi:hypothetical protein
MNTSNHAHLRLWCGRKRLASAALSAAIAAVLLLPVGGAALAAVTSNVVPANGKVAGHGYGYWLQRSWQFIFSSFSSPAAKPCQTLIAGGQAVGYLTLARIGPGKHKITCTEPAGRPLYADEVSSECSTFKGDHGNFGTSGPQLKRCARATFKGIKNTTTLDGRRVDMKSLIAASAVYPVHLGKHNPLGDPPGNGRSAAYGYGLLVSGLSQGTHVIHTVAKAGGTLDITWTVHVQ